MRLPEHRRRLRAWRRTRPFWGGLLVMLGGAELLLVPLSPLTVLVSLGLGGIAAIGIGVALILAGLFLWFLPQARAYVSLHALLLSVLSFVATNLGGFLIGMALGIAGSALAFGWTPLHADAAGEESPYWTSPDDPDGHHLALRTQGFAFAGTAEVPTVDGPLKVLVLRMRAASLRDYRLRTRDGGGEYGLAADFMTRVSAEQALVTADVIVTDGLRLQAS
ncbi:DUF6114 domain-containing protein [Streptomyces sp. NPDC091204]|uniref:DUF6114 domain-containing protein n=1 Tax=Streptomyces sp. NPDC091204 TaxID=3155299 RepID=UPI00342F5120